jgi:DNA (cytosine-5)-methyltransferase 1
VSLTLIDFFCGAGGSSQGATAVPGVTARLAANHWARAIESHALNFPATEHFQGDLHDADVRRFPAGELFWASPECFVAGTLILTRRGLVPIEDVREGDMVFTHRRRWRPVVAAMSRPADTIILKGVGLAGGLETTPEHPFYAREAIRSWDNSVRQYRDHLSGESAWVGAQHMAGKLWATPVDFGDALAVPPIHDRPIRTDPAFWWMVGRWLGDGSLRITAERGEVTIVCSFDEADDLAKQLNHVAGLVWQRREMRTASAFTTWHPELAVWLAGHFGRGAGGKTIPAWALTLDHWYRETLLDGYLSADGNVGHVTQVSTISKRLAVGVRMIANSLGRNANLKAPHERPGGRMIEGRTVTERPTWGLSWITGGGERRHFSAEAEGLRWLPARALASSGRRVTVYNITVAEDESYTADGIVVHNCPTWSQARGHRRDYDKQPDLFGETLTDEATDRSRALMWDVPRYLEAMQLRGRPVLAGVVENVTDVRSWIAWREWVASIANLGYRTRLIAINSMHARPRVTPYADQSRDRLYLAYWSVSLGRDPDWDRWLRPMAWCPSCEQAVAAVQWWKRPGNDMGRYRQQYVYRCPRVSCSQIVEPAAMPAAAAIDWTLAGTRIGDRTIPLKPKTIARIEAGLRRYARPITLEAAGNTFERRPGVRTWPVDKPLTTQTATATKALACPPMTVPAGGTWRREATPVDEPMPSRTARENDGLAVPPFLTVNRGGQDDLRTSAMTEPLPSLTASSQPFGLVSPFVTVHRGAAGDVRTGGIDEPLPTLSAGGNHLGLAVPPFIAELRGGQDARPITDPMSTVMTMGAHHGLVTPPELAMIMRNNTPRGDPGQMCTPAMEPLRALTAAGHQSLITWEHLAHLLMPYYGTGVARTAAEPVGAVTATDRWALASPAVSVEDVLFRMLEPGEIGAAMAFAASYQVLGSKRERVRQYGNAVTPPVAEVIISALVEAITGEDLERAA